MKKINTALIGFGFSGATFHAPVLQALPEQFEIAAVMSSNPEKVKQQLGHVTVTDSIDTILDDHAIDLVIITTPNSMHYEQAKNSLLAGKHVIVEKPFVVDSKEGEELIKLAEEKKLVLNVYHNRRWDNDFLTVKQLIQKNTLGDIYTYEAHFDRFRPEVKNRWRESNEPGSGILFDLGSHLIDQALNLFGRPEFILADVFAQRENAVADDYFHLILGYGRLRAILRSGSIIMQPGHRFQVHGTKGSFLKSGIDPQEEALKSGGRPGTERWGEDDPQQYGELFLDGESQKLPAIPGDYSQFYREVCNAINTGGPGPVPAKESLDVIRIIEAAKESSQTQTAVRF
ncbi:oxidoreductase [Bacillus sp. T33-2]|uniref:oxidoreductase n=1 Tax=Bacillus sp. T33-2 TaxID=2054168 RepID=UPI000C756BE2|nr:oxidoreductase [Bacillus sp. T33-2]PLR92578.1 oxidoreductase [Bacillus sp. T33-2]